MVLTASLAFNVILSIRLKQEIDRPGRRSLIGERVPFLTGTTLDHKRARIAYAEDSRPTLLYVFDPYCGWCKLNTTALNALYTKTNSSYRFIGLAISPLGLYDYLAIRPMPFAVYTDLSNRVLSAYRMGPTPHTIVVSRGGKVSAEWIGAYRGDVLKNIESYFRVNLDLHKQGTSFK